MRIYFALLFIYSLDFILLARKKGLIQNVQKLFCLPTLILDSAQWSKRHWRLNNFLRIFMKITTEAFKSFWSYLRSMVLRRIILFRNTMFWRSSKLFKSSIGKQNIILLVRIIIVLSSVSRAARLIIGTP